MEVSKCQIVEKLVAHFKPILWVCPKVMRILETRLQSRFESDKAIIINMESDWNKSGKTKEVALEMERSRETPEM